MILLVWVHLFKVLLLFIKALVILLLLYVRLILFDCVLFDGWAKLVTGEREVHYNYLSNFIVKTPQFYLSNPFLFSQSVLAKQKIIERLGNLMILKDDNILSESKVL